MKRLKTLLLLLFIPILGFSQIYDPVSWTFSYEKTGDGTYDIVLTAEIEQGSHLYAMDIPENGPIPTSFTFEESESYVLVDSTREMSEGEDVFDTAFEMDIRYFSGSAEFRQTVRSSNPSFSVKGFVTYMACDDTRCSPPKDVDFNVTVSSAENGGIEPAGTGADSNMSSNGLLGLFLVSLLLGIAGILTPCVFPMIPMTVAFFSQDSGNKAKSFTQALVFALSIVIIYSLLGIIVSLSSAGANFANALSTHWISNTLFFLFFVIFAASFFGAYEIILPNKWVSSADSKVDKGGFLAAFFLGLTTVLVSFACTGPIVGALLVEAASGDVLRPTVGMFGFGVGFALPFFLFALFPSVMSKLPKSGGWLNSVKVVLGFLMLAFSLKFLSVIDAVYGLGFLTRDVYLAIWITLFFLLGLYLMGKIKFAHDSDLPHIGIFRFVLIIAVFSFTIYLIPGLFGAPLKGISGLLPSIETSRFNITKTSMTQVVPLSGSAITNDEGECGQPKYGDKFTLPYGLQGYYDYEQGMKCAREKGLPVFLDFKGHACSNCKEIEARVWSDPKVQERLRKNFVIIALYCDDRTKLPEGEWITSSVDGKVKNTIGKINADREISMFGTNTQPLYAIVDHDGNPLVETLSYTLDIEEYSNWLDSGSEAFASR